jgi:hypothetical protein
MKGGDLEDLSTLLCSEFEQDRDFEDFVEKKASNTAASLVVGQ